MPQLIFRLLDGAGVFADLCSAHRAIIIQLSSCKKKITFLKAILQKSCMDTLFSYCLFCYLEIFLVSWSPYPSDASRVSSLEMEIIPCMTGLPSISREGWDVIVDERLFSNNSN